MTINPIAQVGAIASSFCGMLSEVCQNTDKTFQNVIVRRYDQNGQLKTFDAEDSTGALVKITDCRYIEEIRTGNLYLDEEKLVVTIKCCFILFGNILLFPFKMVWHVARTAFEVSALGLETIRQLTQRNLSGAWREGISLLPGAIGRNLFALAKAPICSFGVECAALIGLFNPYVGRKWVAAFEKIERNGARYKEVCCPDPDAGLAYKGSAGEIMYVAACFQPRGTSHDVGVQLL
ncbi:MAG: hypothetical protein JSS61_03990 [Verrucomicrobia bacterium]|nr:hypothetical protein [Verrucomicrobiota bacterium]